MAAGVTDRLWEVHDLVALREAYERRRAERAPAALTAVQSFAWGQNGTEYIFKQFYALRRR